MPILRGQQAKVPETPSKVIPRILDKVSVVHLMEIAKRVGSITDEEVAAKMPMARAIHQATLRDDPHPVDASLPTDAHEWVSQRIAINLVARERGYDVERVIAAQNRARQQREQQLEEPTLRPMRTTAEV